MNKIVAILFKMKIFITHSKLKYLFRIFLALFLRNYHIKYLTNKYKN